MSEKEKKQIDSKTEICSDKVKNGRNGTNGTLLILPAPSEATIAEDKKRKEWESTKARKKIFLGVWERTLGAVKATCDKASVPRRTFYNWMHDDPEFAEAINGHYREMLEDIDQAGKLKIMEGDSAMIRFYLERLHPAFKPKVKFEGGPAVGEVSLEQEYDQINWANDNKFYGNNIQQLNRNPEPVENPKQTGIIGAVPS
jgi:hypothetical protein